MQVSYAPLEFVTLEPSTFGDYPLRSKSAYPGSTASICLQMACAQLIAI